MSKEIYDESFCITSYIRTFHLSDSKNIAYGVGVVLSIVGLFEVLSEYACNRRYPGG